MLRRNVFAAVRTGNRLMCSTADEVTPENTNTAMRKVFTGDRGINKVTLVGRVGRNAEMRGSDSHPVTLFSIATSESFQKSDGTYEQMTEWHRVAVFKPGLREAALRIAQKGSKIFVTGAIKYSDYQPTEDSPAVKSTSIIADDVMLLG